MNIHRRSLIIGTITAPLVSGFPTASSAATPPVYAERGIAIDGTDPLSYFEEGAPSEGSDAFTVVWKGATWRFTSAKRRDQFASDPQAYAPQYGGYCAWAVSNGYTASTVPDAWKIVDGKLYLNYSRRIQRRWERDIPGRIAAADANWPGVLA